jgi:hypothetical protein
MAESITSKIITSIVAALTNSPSKPVGMTVERSLRRPVEPTELPITFVRPLQEPVQRIGTNVRGMAVERTLKVEVAVRCKGNDLALDPLRNWVIATVMADMSVGGVAIEITEDLHDWAAEDATDGDYTQDVIVFAVRYQTSRKTPESK